MVETERKRLENLQVLSESKNNQNLHRPRLARKKVVSCQRPQEDPKLAEYAEISSCEEKSGVTGSKELEIEHGKIW